MPVLHLGETHVPIMACGFDVDGTLRDTGTLAYRNCCEAIRILGGKPQDHATFVHEWNGELIAYYRSCGVTKPETEIREVNRRFLSMNNEPPPYADVEYALAMLEERNLLTFALSGHTASDLEEWCRKHRLHTRFRHVRGDGKTKVGHLRDICAMLGVEPSKTCYIGDWGHDMRAAKEAGMLGIGITRGHATHDILRRNGASLVVGSLAELINLFR